VILSTIDQNSCTNVSRIRGGESRSQRQVGAIDLAFIVFVFMVMFVEIDIGDLDTFVDEIFLVEPSRDIFLDLAGLVISTLPAPPPPRLA